MTAGQALLPILFGLGILGALAAYRRTGWQFAIFAVAALVLPLLGMMKYGNPALMLGPNGQILKKISYWGNLFVPLALALWPVALCWVPAHAGPGAPIPAVQLAEEPQLSAAEESPAHPEE
jgi:hypothetical protein